MEDKAEQETSIEQESDNANEACFTIMPFGGWFDQYYWKIYKPAIESAGLTAHRADDLYRPSAIVHDIWDYTQTAKVILADLTGKNPNVFYELGLGHALAKPVILVSESIADVPFDLRALRVIEYDKNVPDWGNTLQENIKAAILETLEAPLSSILPTFLHTTDSKNDTSVTEHEKELLEIKQEMELLRQEVTRTQSGRLEDIGHTRHTGPYAVDPEEAQILLERWIADSVPERLIVERLTALGAPEDWIVERLVRLGEANHPAREAARSNLDQAPKEQRSTTAKGKREGGKRIGKDA